MNVALSNALIRAEFQSLNDENIIKKEKGDRCSTSLILYKIELRRCNLKSVFGYALREIAYHLRIHSTTINKMISEGQAGR